MSCGMIYHYVFIFDFKSRPFLFFAKKLIPITLKGTLKNYKSYHFCAKLNNLEAKPLYLPKTHSNNDY